MSKNGIAQEISDRFHTLTDDVDVMIGSLSTQLHDATQVRLNEGLTGMESQRTIAHLSEALARAAELRKCITLAHSSAEKDAEKADFPFVCPDKKVPGGSLRLVKN